MSQHFKCLTLGGLNEVWDELMERDNEQKQRIEQAQHVAILEANRNSEETLHRAKEEMIQKLSNEMGALQNSTNRQLAELDRAHRQRLSRMADQLYGDITFWTRSQLNEANKTIDNLSKEVDGRLKDQQKEIDSLQVNIKDIFQKFENEEKRAQELTDFVETLLNVVKQRTPVDRYTPDQLRNVERRLRDLTNSCNPAASNIATADSILHDVLDMEEEAVRLKIKHDTLVETTRTRIEAVLKVIHQNRRITVDRNECSAEIETNFWTRNGYEAIQKRLERIHCQLKEEAETLSDDEIGHLLKTVEEENQNALACMQEAIRQAILSQSRAEISLDIVNAMIRQGYVLKNEDGDEAFDYMGGEIRSDWREGFFAILQDPRTGDEISVMVTPDGNGKDNDIAFHLNGEERIKTEKQYMEDLRRIREEIKKSGYELGEIEAPDDGGNERMPVLESAESLRDAGAAEQLRKRMG